jgi:hypothetical protein
MSRGSASWLLVAGGLLLAGGLAGQGAQAPVGRRFARGTWAVTTIVAGADLLQPFHLRATRDAVLVFDFGDSRLKAFDVHGEPLWQFGQRGHGPWEIAALADVQVTSTGEVLLADRGNSRITVLGPHGERRRMVSLGAPMHRVLPAARGGFLAAIGHGLWWERFDSTGRRLGPLPVPAALAGLNGLSAEPISLALPDARGAVAFRWSDLVLILDAAGGVAASIRGPERLEFPETRSFKAHADKEGDITVTRVASDAVWASFAVAAVGPELWVVFAGAKKEDVRRLVDIYDPASGQYKGSLHLPARPLGIAGLAPNTVALLYDDPEPRIDVLRWIPERP